MDIQLVGATLIDPLLTLGLDELVKMASLDELFDLVLELDAFFISIMAMVVAI